MTLLSTGSPERRRPLVLITDCDHPDIDIERAVFNAAGLDVRLARCRTEDDVLAAGGSAVAPSTARNRRPNSTAGPPRTSSKR